MNAQNPQANSNLSSKNVRFQVEKADVAIPILSHSDNNLGKSLLLIFIYFKISLKKIKTILSI